MYVVMQAPAPAEPSPVQSTANINLIGGLTAPLTATQEAAILTTLNRTFAEFSGVSYSIASVAVSQ